MNENKSCVNAILEVKQFAVYKKKLQARVLVWLQNCLDMISHSNNEACQ